MSAYGPTIGLSATHSRVFEVASFALPGQTVSLVGRDTSAADLQVSHTIYTSGRRRAQVRAAAAGRTSARAAEARTRQVVAANVKLAYYGVLTAQETVSVAQDALASAQEQLRVAEARVRAGTAAEFDQIRAEAQAAQAQEALLRAQNGVRLSRNALNYTLGIPLDTDYQLSTSLAAPREAPALEQMEQRALERRPELVQARAALTAARAQEAIARSGLRPNVMVGAGYRQVLKGSILDVSTPSVTAALAWDLYDAGLTPGRLAQAKSEEQSAALLEEQFTQTIQREVRDALLNLRSAAERVAATQKTVAAAEEAHRIAQVRYDGEVGILLEVIDAQAALTAARNDYNLALYEHHLAATELALAVGEPVEPQPPTAP